MSASKQKYTWASGDAYEPYVGRWSRLVAREFLAWLAIRPGACWLDIGCGTGVLSQTILEVASPRSVLGVDLSEGYLAFACEQIHDTRAEFLVGDALALPVVSASYDAVVSGLMLNFVSHIMLWVYNLFHREQKHGTGNQAHTNIAEKDHHMLFHACPSEHKVGNMMYLTYTRFPSGDIAAKSLFNMSRVYQTQFFCQDVRILQSHSAPHGNCWRYCMSRIS